MFEIGNSLREARVRRGVDFAQAEVATKIRGKYLRALEEEQFTLLPAQTYVKGFLRTYAEYLGLDGQLYVDEFNSRFVAGTDEHEPRPRRSAARPQRRNRRLETNVVLLALAVIAILMVVVISAWKATGDGGNPAATTTAPKPKTTKRVTGPLPLIVIRPKTGSSYVTIRKASATGDVVFNGTVTQGDAPRPFSGTRLWVAINSPENVRVIINGHTVVVPGLRPRVGLVTRRGWHTL